MGYCRSTGNNYTCTIPYQSHLEKANKGYDKLEQTESL
jgi:hypothetical protein